MLIRMSSNLWLGGIYLQNGGHIIVLKALKHYKNRVSKIGNDPQLQDAAITLRMLISDEGKKTAEKVDSVMKIISAGKNDPNLINQTQFEVPLMEKALKCYQADIKKITHTMQKRYGDLFDEPKNLYDDLPLIDNALKEINRSC